MREKTYILKYVGEDPIMRVEDIGELHPGDEKEINEYQAQRVRNILRGDLFLLDGEPSYVEPKEKVEIKGKVPATKREALKDTAEEAVESGALPPQEKEITVAANMKKKGGK